MSGLPPQKLVLIWSIRIKSLNLREGYSRPVTGFGLGPPFCGMVWMPSALVNIKLSYIFSSSEMTQRTQIQRLGVVNVSNQ